MPVITVPDDELLPGEALVPVADAGWREVRPLGWSHFFPTLDAEDVGDGWVRLLWSYGHDLASMPSPLPPGPFTMFERHELVVVR